MDILTEKVVTRFWSKCEKTDSCWNWVAKSRNNGYGFYSVKKHNKVHHFFAHRLAWQLTNGPIPKGQCVLHKCDNKLCVNPDHLFLGSNSDNIKDMLKKGRQVKGSKMWSSKLSEEQVREIREKNKTQSKNSLALEYGVSRQTILNICLGRSWKHV